MTRASALHCLLPCGPGVQEARPEGGLGAALHRGSEREGPAPILHTGERGSQRQTRGDQGRGDSKRGLETKSAMGQCLELRTKAQPADRHPLTPHPTPPNTCAHKAYILKGPWLD